MVAPNIDRFILSANMNAFVEDWFCVWKAFKSYQNLEFPDFDSSWESWPSAAKAFHALQTGKQWKP